jgi:hypothetical protein
VYPGGDRRATFRSVRAVSSPTRVSSVSPVAALPLTKCHTKRSTFVPLVEGASERLAETRSTAWVGIESVSYQRSWWSREVKGSRSQHSLVRCRVRRPAAVLSEQGDPEASTGPGPLDQRTLLRPTEGLDTVASADLSSPKIRARPRTRPASSTRQRSGRAIARARNDEVQCELTLERSS